MGQLARKDELQCTLDLGFGVFDFYQNILVGEVREGAVITADHALELMSFAVESYRDAPSVVYLSNRKHSYSIDPTLHLETGKAFPNLAGYGIVCYTDVTTRTAELEQRFLPYPSRIFNSLDAAMVWAGERLQTGTESRPHSGVQQPVSGTG